MTVSVSADISEPLVCVHSPTITQSSRCYSLSSASIKLGQHPVWASFLSRLGSKILPSFLNDYFVSTKVSTQEFHVRFLKAMQPHRHVGTSLLPKKTNRQHSMYGNSLCCTQLHSKSATFSSTNVFIYKIATVPIACAFFGKNWQIKVHTGPLFGPIMNVCLAA